MAAVHLAGLSFRGREERGCVPPHIFRREPIDGRVPAGRGLELAPAARRAVPGGQLRARRVGPGDVSRRDRRDPRQRPELLRRLAADNMLIAPRGDGLTYRCHQLFRDLLQYRLRGEPAGAASFGFHKLADMAREPRGAGPGGRPPHDRRRRPHGLHPVPRSTRRITGHRRADGREPVGLGTRPPPGREDRAVRGRCRGCADHGRRARRIDWLDNEDRQRRCPTLGGRGVEARRRASKPPLLRCDPAAAEAELRGVAPIEGEADPILDHVVLLKSRTLLWLDDRGSARGRRTRHRPSGAT